MPLHLAIKNNSERITTFLLSRGANVNGQRNNASGCIAADTGKGCTPLYLAVEKGNEEVNNDKTTLHLAMQHGYLKIIEHLLKYRADVNSVYTSASRDGYTPLHFAAENGHKEIMKLLLSRGSDINAKGNCGKTSLHLAVEHGYLKIVEHLLTYEADVNSMYTSATSDSCIPLHLAADNGHKEIVKLLLSREADVNARDFSGRRTALYYAIVKGNTEVVELLLKCGTNQHATIESDFMSLLPRAARFGHITIAEVDSTDRYGAITFTYACATGHEQLVTALLEHAAHMTIERYYNMLHVALDGIKVFCDIDHCLHEYYHCDSHDISTYINIADILKRHRIKMKVANLYAVNEYVPSIRSDDEEQSNFPNISSDDEEQSDFPNESDKEIAHVYYSKKVREERMLARNNFQNECEKGIASMKSEKIGNADITFYDILTKDIHQLTIYARNENVVVAIRSVDYRKKFPIYVSIINSNFRKGVKRKEFLEQAYKNFHFLYNNFPQLSRSCTERIFFYLNNEDLTALMDTCKPIVYC